MQSYIRILCILYLSICILNRIIAIKTNVLIHGFKSTYGAETLINMCVDLSEVLKPSMQPYLNFAKYWSPMDCKCLLRNEDAFVIDVRATFDVGT